MQIGETKKIYDVTYLLMEKNAQNWKGIFSFVSIPTYNFQSNKMHSIVFGYSILQYLVNQSNMFRFFMGYHQGFLLK
jgi:hypothetical protein